MDVQVVKATPFELNISCKPECPEKVTINNEIFVPQSFFQSEKVQYVIDKVQRFLSTVLTLACLGLICYALSKGYAALEGHPIIMYCLFFFSTTLLAYLEGLQICILALERVNRETFRHMKRAYNNHKLATAKHGLNVQRFLVGRQFFVVFVVFLNAQVTTYTKMKHELASIPEFLFILIIETGFPGVLVVLAFGQLMPQLIASTHPITFMNLPGANFVIQLALCFEAIGVTHFSWVLTFITKWIFGLKNQEDFKITKSTGPSRRTTPFNSKKLRKITPMTRNDFSSFITKEKMYVNIIGQEAETLVSGAQDGMKPASEDDLKHQDISWTQDDSVQKLFHKWGYDKKSGFPSPEEIVRHLVKNGLPVPRYLLPKHHPRRIPPYIVVMEIERRRPCMSKCKDDGIEA